MIDASTQTGLGSTTDPLAGAEAQRKVMVDASTQTSEDDGSLTRSSGHPLSPTTLVNTPTDQSSEVDADDSEQHDAAQYDGMVHEAQDEEEHVQETDSNKEIPTAIEDLREELAQLRAQITGKDGRLETYRRLLGDAEESHEQLKEENNNLQSQLDEASLRVSELQISNETLETQAQSLKWRVEDLSSEVVWMLDVFRWGREELSFFVQLGAKLYARVVKAEKKGALRRSDSLVNLAGRRLSEYVTVERYIRDLVTEHKVGLAIEGPPAHPFAIHDGGMAFACERTSDDDALERLVDEEYEAKYGEAVNNGDAAGYDSSPSSSDNEEEETHKRKKTTSIFEAAAGINLSPPSSETKEDAAKKTKTSIFDAAATISLSPPLYSDDKTALGKPFEQETKGSSANPKLPSMGSFNFSETAAKGEETMRTSVAEEETRPLSGAERSTQFSFLPSGFIPTFGGFNHNVAGSSLASSDSKAVDVDIKEEQKQESTENPATPPLFTAEAFARFDSPSTAKIDVGSSFSWNFSGSSSQSSDASKETSFGKFSGLGVFPGDTNPGPSPIFGNLPESSAPSTRPSAGFSPSISNIAKAPTSSKSPLFSKDAFQKSNVSKVDVQRPSVMSSETAYDASAVQEPTLADPAECDDGLLVRRPSSTVEGLAASPRKIVACCPDLNGDYDELYDIEDDYIPPAKRPTTVETVQKEPELAVGTADVLSENGFDPAALSRIVNSASPAAQGNIRGGEDLVMRLIWQSNTPTSRIKTNGARREVWQGRGRTAAEISAGWDIECRERTKQQIVQMPWRESEWPAALPPLHRPEREMAAELPDLAIPRITATTAHEEMEATEEEIVRIMGAIEALHIGPSIPRAIVRNVNAEKHVLSGDWVARRTMTRPTTYQQADDEEKTVEPDDESGSREGVPEVVSEREGHLEQSEMASGDEPQVEIVSKEVPRVPAGDAQEAKVICKKDANAEPEVAMRNEPQVTVSPTRSNDVVRPQMPPQTGMQENSTATSHSQTLETHPQMVPQLQSNATFPSHRPQTTPPAATQENSTAIPPRTQAPESTGYTAPRDKKGGLRIWSLRRN